MTQKKDPLKKLKPVACKLSTWDTEELAAYLVGRMDEQHNYDDDQETIDGLLMDKYNIDLDDLHRLVCVLLPMADTAKSGLTNRRYRCFSTVDEKGEAHAFQKTEVSAPWNNYTKK